MVCLGNICRSPLAHGILESKLSNKEFYVDSAGTGNYHVGSPPDLRSIEVAKKYGVDISHQRCRQFDISDFDNFDIIYVMDESNFSNVVKLARNPLDISKVQRILNPENHNLKEVPDPYYGNHKDFENVFSILNNACETISSQLTKSN